MNGKASAPMKAAPTVDRNGRRTERVPCYVLRLFWTKGAEGFPFICVGAAPFPFLRASALKCGAEGFRARCSPGKSSARTHAVLLWVQTLVISRSRF